MVVLVVNCVVMWSWWLWVVIMVVVGVLVFVSLLFADAVVNVMSRQSVMSTSVRVA